MFLAGVKEKNYIFGLSAFMDAFQNFLEGKWGSCGKITRLAETGSLLGRQYRHFH
jgi:hypothetical protein